VCTQGRRCAHKEGGVHTRKAVCTQGRRCAHKEGGVSVSDRPRCQARHIYSRRPKHRKGSIVMGRSGPGRSPATLSCSLCQSTTKTSFATRTAFNREFPISPAMRDAGGSDLHMLPVDTVSDVVAACQLWRGVGLGRR